MIDYVFSIFSFFFFSFFFFFAPASLCLFGMVPFVKD